MIENFTPRKLKAIQNRVHKLYRALSELDKYAAILHAAKDWRGAPEPHPDDPALTREVRSQLRRTRNASLALMAVVRDRGGRTGRTSARRFPRAGRVVARCSKGSSSPSRARRTTA